MVEQSLTLYGPDCIDGKPRPEVLGPFFGALGPLLRDNARQAFFSSSRVAGRPARSLRNAWEVRFVGVSKSADAGTRLCFEAPTLGEAAKELYAQSEIWPDKPDPEDTVFDLLGHTLADVSTGQMDSRRFDRPLLNRLARFSAVFRLGVERVEMGGRRANSAVGTPVIESALIGRVASLARATPASRRVRVRGRLDMVRCSNRVFELMLEDGARLRAIWVPQDLSPVAEHLNRDVLVEGEAVFRPSGTVLRMDAGALRPAGARDQLFSALPVPVPNSPSANGARQTSARRQAGFKNIVGAWPGDESIEELVATLAELGR